MLPPPPKATPAEYPPPVKAVPATENPPLPPEPPIDCANMPIALFPSVDRVIVFSTEFFDLFAVTETSLD